MAETLCPNCGFSPIPARAERCPRCKERFVEDQLSLSGITRTEFGGLTGSVTASPGAIVFALLCGTALWVVRGLGVLGDVGDPSWVYALAVLQVLSAVALVSSSPAKQAPALAGVLECGAALMLAAPWPVTVLCVAHGLGLVLGTVAEPAQARLMGAGAFSSIAALAGLAVLPMTARTRQVEAPLVVLRDPLVGFSVTLPAGWEAASRADLGLELAVPLKAAGSGGVAFKGPGARLLGVLEVSSAAAPEACLKVLAAMKLTAEGDGPVWAVKSHGGTGHARCTQSDQALVALAVVSLDGDDAAAGRALEALSAGFTR